MVQIQSPVRRLVSQLVLISALLPPGTQGARAQKFYPDDPVWVEPKPRPVEELPVRTTGVLYDFLRHSFAGQVPPPTAARGVNTLGGVPDNAWFTNRHAVRRMAIAELKRGSGTDSPPGAPFTVIGAKTDGITPGFRMQDAAGRLYFVKPDPRSNPEMATAADVIVSRFFHALGYFTPQNYLLYLKRSDIKVSPDARVDGLGGKRRVMMERDLDDILREVPRRKDGTYRMVASLAAQGTPIGPFRYEGTRSDDPHDTIPHEYRRELRGLFVLCSWLNHTDAKSINSLDTLVEDNGIRYVRHNLIDFGSALGSDSDMPKNARFGNEYVVPSPRSALGRMAAFGFDVRPWESADYGGRKAVGRFESKTFDPAKWKSNYPNPAFLRRQPDDEYWAAKLVMAFRDEDMRAIVETGEFADPKVVDYIARVLIERRDKIGRLYFGKVLPLDNFTIRYGELKFDDLAVKYGFGQPPAFEASWFAFDNHSAKESPAAGAAGMRVPEQARQAADGSYWGARIRGAE